MATLTKGFDQLMEDMARGSEEAAWELAERYTPHIIRAVRASLPSTIRSKIDSQDFAQIVWGSILLKRCRLAQFDTPQQFMDYLATVARNKVIDAYRKLRTRKRDVRSEVPLGEIELENLLLQQRVVTSARCPMPASKEPTPSQVAIVREIWTRLIENCSPRDRNIVALRVKGLYYTEIADQLSIGEKTVRRVLGRLLDQLHE